MAAWTNTDLERIGGAEELQITPIRRDGTLAKPVTIWVVRDGDDLYVRSYLGSGAAWFRAAQARPEGRIQAGGIDKDVLFVDADRHLNDQIDGAYRTKYTPIAPSYVEPMVSHQARATTFKLVPRT